MKNSFNILVSETYTEYHSYIVYFEKNGFDIF